MSNLLSYTGNRLRAAQRVQTVAGRTQLAQDSVLADPTLPCAGPIPLPSDWQAEEECIAALEQFKRGIKWRSYMRALAGLAFSAPVIAVALVWASGKHPVASQALFGYLALLAVSSLLVFAVLGFLRRGGTQARIEGGSRAGLAIYLGIPISYALFCLLPQAEVRSELVALSIMTGMVGLWLCRVGSALPGSSPVLAHRVMVFGIGEAAMAVDEALNQFKPGVEIVGYYPGSSEHSAVAPTDMILPRTRSLTDTALALQVDEIVVAVTERRGGAMPLREMLDCRLYGIRVSDLESHFEERLGQIRLDSLYAGWLIFGNGFRQGLVRTAIKRAFDVVCASVLLLLALPVMALVSLLIVLDDGFPILYRQERVGLHGRLFNVIKFRSMRNDAEKDGVPRWAANADDRITRIGRIMRKLRIDELPQLFSVLKGDMSMVGPRPERPFFVDKLTRQIPFYAARHSVKPGVTGWAQVRYHYGATVEDSAAKLQYDLYYVKNHNLLLDLLVLFETVGVVLTAKGAQ